MLLKIQVFWNVTLYQWVSSSQHFKVNNSRSTATWSDRAY